MYQCRCGPDYDPSPSVSRKKCRQPGWLPASRRCRYLLRETVREWKCNDEQDCTDQDGDGYDENTSDCSKGDDCDDNDASIHPGAAEVCGDGKDNDCDPSTPDECCSITVTPHRYSHTLDVGAGAAVSLGGTITEESGNPVNWTLSVAGQTFSGTGNTADVRWSGLDDSGKFETKTYPVKLFAETTDGECSDSVAFDITVTKTEDCRLKVTVGSSANVAGGELTDSLDLFSVAGAGPAVDFGLYYASQDGYNGPLGLGWYHSYDIALSEQSTGDVVLKTGSGQWRLYTRSGSGYTSPPGDYSTLVNNADGTFTLTKKDGIAYRFSARGKIAVIADRNGNTLNFTYADGLLATVTDVAGRAVTFSYDDAGKLASVVDPAGNSYDFSVSGDVLTALTLPNGGVGATATMPMPFSPPGSIRSATPSATSTTSSTASLSRSIRRGRCAPLIIPS